MAAEPRPIQRRSLLLGLGGGLTMAACGGGDDPTAPAPASNTGASAPPPSRPTVEMSVSGSPTPPVQPSGAPSSRAAGTSKVLVAFFSRAGENYFHGDRTWLEVGNTEVVARMVPELISCDIYEIEAAEPYPAEYAPTVRRNVTEQDNDARPAIANPLPSIDQYDVVLLGSPIWNVRAPMIMSTFAESYDFTGKTVHPFTTYAMSGLGTTERDYAQVCAGATIGEGLAVQGEEAMNGRPLVVEWLTKIGLNPRS